MRITNTFVASVSSKGQVTIPVELRRILGISEPDRVLFREVDGLVVLEPVRLTIESAFGSVQPKAKPEDIEHIRAAVREERVKKIVAGLSDE